ncbi:MAG: hypothetical protein ACKPB8_04945, partial [Alphaproteobacteria bacterium]
MTARRMVWVPVGDGARMAWPGAGLKATVLAVCLTVPQTGSKLLFLLIFGKDKCGLLAPNFPVDDPSNKPALL